MQAAIASAEESAVLQLKTAAGLPLSEMNRCWSALNDAYAKLWTLDILIHGRLTFTKKEDRYKPAAVYTEGDPAATQPEALRVPAIVRAGAGIVDDVVKYLVQHGPPPSDELTVLRVHMDSPGIWEFLGKLNPLEVLRQFLNDRHERRKDREYREAAERERLLLENQKRRSELGTQHERAIIENDLMKLKLIEESAGVLSRIQRSELPLELLVKPLQILGRQIDRGFLEEALLLPSSSTYSAEREKQEGFVRGLLPEIGRTDSRRALRVADFLIANVYGSKLSTQNLLLLRNCLIPVLSGHPDEMAGPLLDYFSSLERKWRLNLSRLQDQLKQSHERSTSDPRIPGFGDLLKIYMANIEGDGRHQGVEEFVAVRNSLVHGSVDFCESWQRVLSEVIRFLPATQTITDWIESHETRRAARRQ